MESLLLLMPKDCKCCNNHYASTPGFSPEVCCLRCGIMACPSCYHKEDNNGDKWRYVCEDCENIIIKQAGINAIDEKFLMKKSSKSSADPIPEEESRFEEIHDDDWHRDHKYYEEHSGGPFIWNLAI